MARFLQGSRYTNGVVSVNRDNDQFLILRNILNIAPATTDTYLSVTNVMLNRPDIISYTVYQRPDLWWAIFDVNGIKSPYDVQLNQQLRIPALNIVLSAINTLNLNL